MEKKKNKGIVALIIVLIVIILGLSGYIVYDKVLKVEEPAIKEDVKEEVKEVDFYDVSELLKNNYIEKIESTVTEFIKISDGKVFVISNYEDSEFTEAEGIVGTPKYVYGASLCSDCQNGFGYVVLTEEGNVYYSENVYDFDEETEEGVYSVKKFEKLNSDYVENIYKLPSVKGIYEGFAFYETNAGDLISVKENKTFKEIWAYPDLSFRLHTGYSILYFISSDKKVFLNDKSEVTYNGESIYAKDIFYKDNVDLSEQETYIIGQNNQIYLIKTPITAEAKDDKKVSLYTEKEVKDYKIVNTDNFEKEFRIDITYTDGSTETFEKSYVSTLYFRNK